MLIYKLNSATYIITREVILKLAFVYCKSYFPFCTFSIVILKNITHVQSKFGHFFLSPFFQEQLDVLVKISTRFESIKIRIVVEKKMLADKEDFRLFEYRKRITDDMLTATQCSVNTVKAVRRKMNCQPKRLQTRGQQEGTQQTFWLYLHTRTHPTIAEQGGHHHTGLEWGPSLPFEQKMQRINSDSQSQGELLDEGKEAPKQVDASCWTGDDLILLRWKTFLPGPVVEHTEQ